MFKLLFSVFLLVCSKSATVVWTSAHNCHLQYLCKCLAKLRKIFSLYVHTLSPRYAVLLLLALKMLRQNILVYKYLAGYANNLIFIVKCNSFVIIIQNVNSCWHFVTDVSKLLEQNVQKSV